MSAHIDFDRSFLYYCADFFLRLTHHHSKQSLSQSSSSSYRNVIDVLASALDHRHVQCAMKSAMRASRQCLRESYRNEGKLQN